MLVKLAKSQVVSQLEQAIGMLDCDDPAEFLSSELGAKCIPLPTRSRDEPARESGTSCSPNFLNFRRHVEHIRSIVSKQQKYAKSTQMLERCLPDQVFEDALEMTLHQPARKGISIEKHFDAAGQYDLDRHRTLEILVNLLRNAVDALMSTESVRLIAVSTKLDDDGFVRFTVRDSGVGISAEDQKRIFQPRVPRRNRPAMDLVFTAARASPVKWVDP